MNLSEELRRSLCYDKDGSPLKTEEWCQKFEDLGYRRIAKTHVGPFCISTVWLGLDHAFCVGKPLIFETMVFPHCEDQYRYHTLEEAKTGHKRVVAEYRAKFLAKEKKP